MRERPENLEGFGEESEATLVAPRFDADDARRAHPVVPLAEARPSNSYVDARAPRAYTRRGRRRFWMPALVAVMLFAAAALGGAVATKLMRDTRSPTAAAQTPNEAAPSETAPAQTVLNETAPNKTASNKTASNETAPAQTAPTRMAAARAGAESPAAPAREDVSALPAPRSTRGRRERDVPSLASAEAARGEDENFEDEDQPRRHDLKRHRRGRDEDEGEKELRKALKHAEQKAPRLVDVLTPP